MRLRSTRMGGISVRNAAIRQRSKMDKRLKEVRETMAGCDCVGEGGTEVQVNMKSRSSEQSSTVSEKTAAETFLVETNSGDGTVQEHDRGHEIQKVNVDDHEYVRQCDVPKNHGLGIETMCGEATEDAQREDGDGDGILNKNAKKVEICWMCRRSGVAVEKMEKSMLEMNDIIRSLNERIIEQAKEADALKEQTNTQNSQKIEGAAHGDTSTD